MARWFSEMFVPSTRVRPLPSGPRFQPKIEVLEDRLAPTVYYVSSVAPDGPGTLQSQVANAEAAGSGNTVEFSVSNVTIALTSTVMLKNNVIINGINASTNSNITITNTTGSAFEASGTATLSNLTVSNNQSGTGGGALTVDSGASLVLNNDDFYNNTQACSYGGAIWNAGTLTATNCYFCGNSANGAGGGIYNTGTLSLNECTLSTNSAGTAGGGICSSGGSVTIANSTLMANTAGTTGGGLATFDNTTLTNDTFSSNTASGDGGGIYTVASTPGNIALTVSGSTFVLNKSGRLGGAIAATDDLLNVSLSTFLENSASSAGGGVYWEAADTGVQNPSMFLNFDSFSNNTAATGGGGVAVYVHVNSGVIQQYITDSTFNNNVTGVGGSGGGLYLIQETVGSATSQAFLVNDTFFKNQAANGGGLAAEATNTGTGNNTVELTSLTVYQNTASGSGGGVYLNQAQSVTVDNSIFDGNSVTAAGYTGPLDVTLVGGASLNDVGYNLVDVTDYTPFTNSKDVVDFFGNPGVSSTLAQNGAPSGYPETLALTNMLGMSSLALGTGDPTLLTRGNPWPLDERGFTRTSPVSIGAYDPNATSP